MWRGVSDQNRVHDFGCPSLRGFRRLGILLMVSGDFAYVKLGFLRFVYQHSTGVAFGIVTEGAVC
jgi:hypothetical protein